MQKTQDLYQMLGFCWTTVCDAGSTLKNINGVIDPTPQQRTTSRANIPPALDNCRIFVRKENQFGSMAVLGNIHGNVVRFSEGSSFSHRLRTSQANVKPMVTEHRAIVTDGGLALDQNRWS